ncbi:LIPA.2 family protein [Megaselia abdita]
MLYFLLVLSGLSSLNALSQKILATQIISNDGYPVETHSVKTTDENHLTMFRIPYSPKLKLSEDNGKTSKRIALLVHGASSSSDCFILNGPENSMAYILADAGYDVWLANCRGNRYSNKDMITWDFTFDQMAKYDMPAMIDYALNLTGQTDLHYIAHSQGTTIYFALLSSFPRYNKVIRTAHLLAPAAYMNNIKLPVMKFLGYFYGFSPTLHSLVRGYNFWPDFTTELFAMLGAWACQEKQTTRHICSNLLFSVCGYNPDRLNYSLLPKVMATHPSGVSTRQTVHFSQLYVTGKFSKYDYGYLGNWFKYGQWTPPEYNTENIEARTYIYYADNDYLSAPDDVFRIAREIKNVCLYHKLPDKSWNHMDYLWSTEVKQYINEPLRDYMLEFDSDRLRDCGSLED